MLYFSGWSGVRSIPPQTYTGRALCIILRRYFPCKDSKGSEDRLCDAQYYYWDTEDCDAMPTSLPYVCERPANKIGNIFSFINFFQKIYIPGIFLLSLTKTVYLKSINN